MNENETNNVTNNENNGGNNTQEKKDLRQKAHAFAAKHPKGIRRAKRIGTGIACAVSAIGGFILGKKSVKPAYKLVPVEPEEEPAQEAEEPETETVEE